MCQPHSNKLKLLGCLCMPFDALSKAWTPKFKLANKVAKCQILVLSLN